MSGILDREVFLGGWFNNDDNQYYLDNALLIKDKVEALYIAEAAEQIAVYDLTVPPYGQEIVTNDGIKQLQETGIYRDNIAERYRRGIDEASRLFRKSRLSNPEQGRVERARDADLLDIFLRTMRLQSVCLRTTYSKCRKSKDYFHLLMNPLAILWKCRATHRLQSLTL